MVLDLFALDFSDLNVLALSSLALALLGTAVTGSRIFLSHYWFCNALPANEDLTLAREDNPPACRARRCGQTMDTPPFMAQLRWPNLHGLAAPPSSLGGMSPLRTSGTCRHQAPGQTLTSPLAQQIWQIHVPGPAGQLPVRTRRCEHLQPCLARQAPHFP